MNASIVTKSSFGEKLETLQVGESYEANRIRMVLTEHCMGVTFPGKGFLAADDLIELEMMW